MYCTLCLPDIDIYYVATLFFNVMLYFIETDVSSLYDIRLTKTFKILNLVSIAMLKDDVV